MTTTAYVVSASVADIRRHPDPTSELVTQALMNAPASADERDDAWTHVTLPDYVGWIRSHQLEEPIGRELCKIGEGCMSALSLVAVVRTTHASLYADPRGSETIGTLYLSTVLPLIDTSRDERVQVALPGERRYWLRREDVAIREQTCPFPRTPLRVVTDYARAFLGRDYLWGGISWEGIDCSGFVQLCYRMAGYVLPRDGDQQHDFLAHTVQRTEIQEGDLIFFGSTEITHVALALDAQQYIHAEGQNYDHVVINSFASSAENYYPRLDEIVWDIKRVVV